MGFQRRAAIPWPDAPRGVCRGCGDAILQAAGPERGERDLRCSWHAACRAAWEQSDPREARRRVRRRDRGRCAACGHDGEAGHGLLGPGSTRRLRDWGFEPRVATWQLDHIVPLIDGGTHDLANLQTLCPPCHTQKLRREAAERWEREQERQSEKMIERAELLLEATRRLVGHLRNAVFEIVEQRDDPPRLPVLTLPAQIEREGEREGDR
jgi:5-methylcytosine-specific restriction endonuclease McrA